MIAVAPTKVGINHHATGYIAGMNTLRIVRKGMIKPTLPQNLATKKAWLRGFASAMKAYGWYPVPKGSTNPLTPRQRKHNRKFGRYPL